MARTVDNLGVDISIRYAEDQKNLDSKLIRDASTAAQQTEIDTITAIYPSELNRLLAIDQRGTPYAGFSQPENFESQKKRLFSGNHVVPFFGSQEKKELQIQRIQATAEMSNVDPTIWKKESDIFLSLLQKLTYLDECLEDINGSRAQLQKG